jgi:hypothetical protein
MGKTVWYRLTVSVEAEIEVNTVGSSYDTVLAVYTGNSLATLSLVDCNDDVAPLASGSPGWSSRRGRRMEATISRSAASTELPAS